MQNEMTKTPPAREPQEKTMCIGCLDYPKLLEWRRNDEVLFLPECCRQCANMLQAMEL